MDLFFLKIWRIGRKRSKSYSSGRNLANFRQEKKTLMWAPQSVWLIDECDWDLRYSRLQARRRGVHKRRIPDRCHVTCSHLCDTCRARHLQLGPILLPKYTNISNSSLASCRFSSHKTPPYLIAPLKRTRCSSLQLICLVSLQLVDLICWRCIYKLKALRFRHTPCSSVNEHLFFSVFYFFACGCGIVFQI